MVNKETGEPVQFAKKKNISSKCTKQELFQHVFRVLNINRLQYRPATKLQYVQIRVSRVKCESIYKFSFKIWCQMKKNSLPNPHSMSRSKVFEYTCDPLFIKKFYVG